MNFENVELDEINQKKKNLAKYYNDQKEINDNLRTDTFKMSLINVDSEFRNKTPKNITQVNRNYLSNNPITLKKGSNELKFYQPNHQFKTGDTVTIHNVESYSKTLSNSLYFIDGFEYFMVKFPNHNIDRNYTNYNNTLLKSICS